MKRVLLLVALLSTTLNLFCENRAKSPHQQGTIVRMRMAACLTPQHAFMNAMSGVSGPAGELCPEYVLVTDTVVYVIVGKSSEQLIPLAAMTFFRLQNNEVVIRVDDARKESRFHVKEMVLRPEWERAQQIIEATAAEVMRRHVEGTILVGAQ